MKTKTAKNLKIVRLPDYNKILAVDLKDGSYLTENGQVYKNVTSTTGTRNISPEVKTLLLGMASLHLRNQEIDDEISKMTAEKTKNICSMRQFAIDLVHAQGILTYSEFEEAFLNALPDNVVEAMDEYGYSIDTPTGMCYQDGYMYISRTECLSKYNRNVSFAYEEYDGELVLYDNAEKDKNSQKLIKANSKPLPVKSGMKECLFTGDKYSIWYSACYEIKIDKPLTKEYAESLAKKIV